MTSLTLLNSTLASLGRWSDSSIWGRPSKKSFLSKKTKLAWEASDFNQRSNPNQLATQWPQCQCSILMKFLSLEGSR